MPYKLGMMRLFATARHGKSISAFSSTGVLLVFIQCTTVHSSRTLAYSPTFPTYLSCTHAHTWVTVKDIQHSQHSHWCLASVKTCQILSLQTPPTPTAPHSPQADASFKGLPPCGWALFLFAQFIHLN